MPSSTNPPALDEIEVSIFGPGFGESILIHVGGGEWIAIDSCVDGFTGQSKAITYLKEIGVNPAKAVKVLLASHWHDDHVRGMHALLAAAESAVFCCARALTGKEFISLGELLSDSTSKVPRGPKELFACLREIERRARVSTTSLLFRYASPDRVLWQGSMGSKVLSLSPSDEMDRRCLMFIAETLACLKKGMAVDRLLAVAPNDTAVAVRVDVGGRSLLFGSDLEEEGNPRVGWSAVLLSQLGLETKSGLFKVAHHGSKTGDHDQVWADMLNAQPLSLLTPFRYGRHRLPTLEDRRRIQTRTTRAFITADPNVTVKPKLTKRSKVQRSLGLTAQNRRLAAGPVGHIRWRAPLADSTHPGDVELLDGAMDLMSVSER